MRGYDHSTYGDAFADVYDDWYGDITDTEACVAEVATLAGEHVDGDRAPVVVELGVGTGRLALPLARLGLDVRGIDGSEAMIDRLRVAQRDASHQPVALTVGDFAEMIVPLRDGETAAPSADVVLCACNTFFGLRSAQAQRRCMDAVAGVLGPHGRFVVEAFVPLPADAELDDPSAVRVRHLATDVVVLTAAVRDAHAQTMSGQYVEITEAGIRLRPWHLRYAYLDELDAIATDAGLVLEHRWADWRRAPFGADATHHISVWRPPQR